MRLLHVIAGLDPTSGGVTQAVWILTDGLSAMGIDNEIVSIDAADKPYLSRAGCRVHAVGPGIGPWCYNAKLLRWLKKNIDSFDVVLVHGLWLYHVYAVTKVVRQVRSLSKRGKMKASKIPKVFVMPHGMLDPYFQKAEGRMLKALRNWIFWKIVEGRNVNKADALLFTCQQECTLARSTFHPYHPKEEIVVGMGVIKPPRYHPDMKTAFLHQCHGLRETPYILFLSRLDEKKGVDILLQAYELFARNDINSISRRLPKLVVAGPGLESYYGKRLQQMVFESDVLKEWVYFSGMLAGDAKWGAFYGCDAFILPSHQENFGIAVVEALACSKPVLISDKVNIWSEIAASNSGIVSADNVEGIIESLRRWTDLSEAQKKTIACNAGHLYHQRFTVRAVTARMAAAIRV